MIIDFYVLVPFVSDALFEDLGILSTTAGVSFESGWLDDVSIQDMQRLVSERGNLRGYFGPRKIHVSLFPDGRAVFGDSAPTQDLWGDSPSCREDAIRWQQEFLAFVGKFLKFFPSRDLRGAAFYETRPPMDIAEFEEWMSDPWFAVFDAGEFRFAVPPNVLS